MTWRTVPTERHGNVALRSEPLLCPSQEGRPGSGEKRRQVKGNQKTQSDLHRLLPSVSGLTMSWVVPIFLASSLRSIVLRYKYLLRSSPSRMFLTAFWRLRLSLCSILDTRHKWDQTADLHLLQHPTRRGQTQTWRPLGWDQHDEAAWWWERFVTSADAGRSSPAWGGASRLPHPGLLWQNRRQNRIDYQFRFILKIKL